MVSWCMVMGVYGVMMGACVGVMVYGYGRVYGVMVYEYGVWCYGVYMFMVRKNIMYLSVYYLCHGVYYSKSSKLTHIIYNDMVWFRSHAPTHLKPYVHTCWHFGKC